MKFWMISIKKRISSNSIIILGVSNPSNPNATLHLQSDKSINLQEEVEDDGGHGENAHDDLE